MISSIVWLLHKEFKAISGEYIEPLFYCFPNCFGVKHMCLSVTFMLSMFSHHMPAMLLVHYSTRFHYILCYVCPLCAYLVHWFTLHFCCICLLSIWTHWFTWTFLLHMFTQHMGTLIYMSTSASYVYLAYLVQLFTSHAFILLWHLVCLTWDNTFINIDHAVR